MSMLKPVSRVTLGEQVAAQLSDQIAEGRWKPGEKLPSEAELCFALNIGRSTLREALKKMGRADLIGNGRQHLVSTSDRKNHGQGTPQDR